MNMWKSCPLSLSLPHSLPPFIPACSTPLHISAAPHTTTLLLAAPNISCVQRFRVQGSGFVFEPQPQTLHPKREPEMQVQEGCCADTMAREKERWARDLVPPKPETTNRTHLTSTPKPTNGLEPCTLHPEPGPPTQNPKTQSQNSKPRNSNPEPHTPNSKPRIPNPKPQIPTPAPHNPNPNPNHSTFHLTPCTHHPNP